MREIDRVSGAGVVDVVAALLRQQPVVAGIVDPFEGKRRAQLIALGGMVVDDVQNDLETMGMKLIDHGLEFVGAAGAADSAVSGAKKPMEL